MTGGEPPRWSYKFTLHTRERDYIFTVEYAWQYELWLHAFCWLVLHTRLKHGNPIMHLEELIVEDGLTVDRLPQN